MREKKGFSSQFGPIGLSQHIYVQKTFLPHGLIRVILLIIINPIK